VEFIPDAPRRQPGYIEITSGSYPSVKLNEAESGSKPLADTHRIMMNRMNNLTAVK
jgi:hypothetical protein